MPEVISSSAFSIWRSSQGEDCMPDLHVDGPRLLPELETPLFLRQKLAEMQREAPDCGLGFRKATLPSEIHERLIRHFRSNVANFRVEDGIEEIGSVESGMIPSLFFEDKAFNAQLASELQPLHEVWSGMRLQTSYCYGVRCYQRGAYLHNHVDRLPHIISSTICIDHALSNRWPLHIEDGHGRVSQIDLEPGEFVLYEGARLAHGRPYPLDGDFYAGIFVHFKPADHAANSSGG
jgi:prolyl 4-hydroxylase